MSRSDKKKSSTAELWEMFVLLFSALRPHLERVPTSEQPPPMGSGSHPRGQDGEG